MVESMNGVFQGEKEAWAKALKGGETHPNWEIQFKITETKSKPKIMNFTLNL